MRILLTNDDGIEAKGIQVLADELEKAGHEIIVVAPEKERSAASHSITLRDPLRIKEIKPNWYHVGGTPVDCMILASEVLIKEPVDLVISGINAGQNLGNDILYSGTVGAAIEGMFLGFKAIAISITSYRDQIYESAAISLTQMLGDGLLDLIGEKEILNINVPNVELSEIKGVKITNIGHRRYTDFVYTQKDHRGNDIHWIGGDNPVWEEAENIDADAIRNNYISITPIEFNFTKKESFDKIAEWLKLRNKKLG